MPSPDCPQLAAFELIDHRRPGSETSGQAHLGQSKHLAHQIEQITDNGVAGWWNEIMRPAAHGLPSATCHNELFT